MMKNKIRGAVLLTLCISALSLTACGGEGTISSLTDSDTATSIGTVSTTLTGSGAEVTPTNVLPEIPAQIVTTDSVTPAVSQTTDSTAAGTDIQTPATPATPAAQTESTASTTAPAQNTGTDETTPAAEEDDFEPAGEGNTATCNVEEVNFRTDPDQYDEDNIITTIEEGETVTVLEASDDGKWYKVEYNGRTGWVASRYFD